MLGHELRNPLSPILTALQLMKLRGSDGSERERTVIERQVSHLTRLVDDLLDVSRIARGKVELKEELVELAEVVAKAIEMASPLLDQRTHTLDVDVPRRGLRVKGDSTRLSQVVSNLRDERREVHAAWRSHHHSSGPKNAARSCSACVTRAWASRRTFCRACSICSYRSVKPSIDRKEVLGSDSRSCGTWWSATAAPCPPTVTVRGPAVSSSCGCRRRTSLRRFEDRQAEPAGERVIPPSRWLSEDSRRR